MTNAFHNRIISLFGEYRYKNILRTENLVEELVIEDEPLWYAVLNNRKYLLTREVKKKLPIKVVESVETPYKGKMYYLVGVKGSSYKTVVFKSEKHYNFRDLVDVFANFENSNNKHFLLYKICCMAAFIDSVNFRVSTNAGFGKDSVWECLSILTRDVSVINPRTMAALEYRLFNKVLVLNELSNLEASQNDLVQEFLLLCGDMRTGYEKSTRAGVKTQDYYNIKNLSLVVLFNNLEYYEEIGKGKKYFDKTFTKAVRDRLLPFKFEGKLDTDQFKINESEEVTLNRNNRLYINLLRSFQYYTKNWRKELKPFVTKTELLNLSSRNKQNFDKITKFINLYSESLSEYESLVKELYSCHVGYENMLKKNNRTLNDAFHNESNVDCDVIDEGKGNEEQFLG